MADILQVDIFSYGVMIVHVLSGQWPFPGEANRINPNAPNDLVGVTEFDRREKYINHIGKQHPLMKLIQLCLSNCPSHRPTSSEVHQQVSTVATDHPPSFANRVEMLERIKALGEEKEAMKIEKNNAIAEKNEQITEREQISTRLEKTQSNMDRLQELHSIELEGIHITNYDLKADNEHLQVILKAKEREFDLKLSSKDALISSKSSTIQCLQDKLGQALGTLSYKDSLNVFSPGAKLRFTESAELSISGDIPGQAIVVRKNVYVVLGDKNVLKYSIIEDSWSTLPETPVIYFSIAYLCQRIMLAGGQLPANNQVMGDILEFDEASQQWVRSTSIPPMPTARKLTTAVSWTSPTALIVCGGSDEHCKPVNVVEVYHSKTSQWHAVSPLPFPRDWMTHSIIHDVLYLVGGYEKSAPETYTKTVLSASIPQLLESCLQPSMTPPVQWQSLSIPDIPNHWSTAASLGGCLLVVGGNSIPRLSLGSKFPSVHAYCPSSSSWVLVGELPRPLAGCIAATLPTGELLVIGGLTSEGKWSTTNYKCCLSMQTCIY